MEDKAFNLPWKGRGKLETVVYRSTNLPTIETVSATRGSKWQNSIKSHSLTSGRPTADVQLPSMSLHPKFSTCISVRSQRMSNAIDGQSTGNVAIQIFITPQE
jgi:hypothetical protein